jgi:hypothetical protein
MRTIITLFRIFKLCQHKETGYLNTIFIYATILSTSLSAYVDRVIAQAVSRRLPNATARFRAQVRSCGNCGGQSGTGAVFLRVLGSPLQILIPPTAPHSSSIIRGWYNKPVSGRHTKWTQSHSTPRK